MGGVTQQKDDERVKNLFFIIVLLVVPFASWAQEINQPHISVYGEAKKEVVPDEMHWSISVGNRGAELKQVSAEHTRLVKEVLKIIGQQGIDKKHIQTSGMTFGENYVYRDNSRIKEGYIASTSISFKMDKFEHYEPLWLSLSKVNAVNVNSVSYDYSKRIEAQKETRIAALLAAKEKAASLASVMDLALGEAIAISEDMDSYSYASNKVQMFESRAQMDDGGSSVEPGTITITMKIKLVMGLISK